MASGGSYVCKSGKVVSGTPDKSGASKYTLNERLGDYTKYETKKPSQYCGKAFLFLSDGEIN
jgi:hypothetical protein